MTKLHLPTFIAVDGEGITRPDTKEHIYDMLSCGDRTIVSEDGGQLQWYEIFEFLYNCFREDQETKKSRDKIVYVGFFLGYDFAQWTRTLPKNRGEKLWSKKGRESRRYPTRTFPVDIKAPNGVVWEIDILANKRFQLKPQNESKIMYINDSGPFFQTSFINVIAPKGKVDTHVVSIHDFQIIQDGKANRGHEMFLEEQLATREETMRYNLMENEILSKVMTRQAEGLSSIGINLNSKSWYGPGQAAQAWLDIINVEDAEALRENLTTRAFEASQASYYGGWFEILNHGHVPGTVWEYDINSAYPSVIADLPCLTCGLWEELSETDEPYPHALTLSHVTVSGGHPDMGPLPFRTREGKILRPLHTSGWYWQHEIDAAERAGLIEEVEVHERLSYVPARNCDHNGGKPFAEIADLYEKRLEVGKNTPAGKAYKLVYNSAYGKMAQSVGNPKFASSVYASLITAGCRVMILDAIATHPVGVDDVVMIATDGIYFRSEHYSLNIDPEKLGAWDVSTKQNLTLLMPGVYWDDKVRKDASSLELKSRGINAKTLAKEIGRLDDLFSNALDTLDNDSLDQSFTVFSEFDMVTPGSACNMNKWELTGTLNTYLKDGKLTVGSKRDISTDPSLKRDTSNLWVDRGSIRSQAYDYATDSKGFAQDRTTPYDKNFGYELSEMNEELQFTSKDYQGNFISF